VISNDTVMAEQLAPLLDRQAKRHGLHAPVEGLMLSRFVDPSEPLTTVQHPVYSVVVQGVKEAMIGKEVIRYAAGDSLIAGVDLPVTARIVEASSTRPYLSVSLALDCRVVLDLLGDQWPQPTFSENIAPFGVKPFDPRLADPLVRLLELLDRPNEIPILSPLIYREIIWRLLQSPFAGLLRQSTWPEGQIARIARATRWIRENFDEPLRVSELAARVHMSVPSFHRHFKAITSVSPLQFQKQVRLHNARRRLFQSERIGRVAFEVGYESLSQFNRDYLKLYGLPPSQDVAGLRQEPQPAAPTS
jgi:AraC-like DNA-binding protein